MAIGKRVFPKKVLLRRSDQTVENIMNEKTEQYEAIETMDDLIAKWDGHCFEDCGPITSQDFIHFMNNLRVVLRHLEGWTVYKCTKVHYHSDIFMEKNGQMLLIRFDVPRRNRQFNMSADDKFFGILVGRVKNDRDFHPTDLQITSFVNLVKTINEMVK